jgi:DNA-binding NtrC family response regulator
VTSRTVRSALVVEDDPDLRTGIATFLRQKGLRVGTATTAGDAIAQLSGRPDVILLDVRLPDSSAFEVLEAAHGVWPAPLRIALSGAATPEETFRLSRYGVRRFLQKPVSLAQIWEAIQSAADEAPDLQPVVQDAIGHRSLREITNEVRDVAIRQAVSIARGNRSRAARILQVTRQAVQQMMRQPPKGPPAS